MNIKTKFSLGDKVYPISHRHETVFVKCDLCHGAGKISISGSTERRTCPDCYGHGGKNERLPMEWRVDEDSYGKIGRVTAEIYAERYLEGRRDHPHHYMLSTTGVGWGTIWYEDRLFLTEEEAQKECDKRNIKLNIK